MTAPAFVPPPVRRRQRWQPRHALRTLAALAALLPGACGRGAPPATAPGPPRVQAALPTITVENRTGRALTIDFRPAGRTRGRVRIGSVAPGETRRLAPVPAGEPIVLSARTAEGGALELPSRTFSLDEQWHWVIPVAAVFR